MTMTFLNEKENRRHLVLRLVTHSHSLAPSAFRLLLTRVEAELSSKEGKTGPLWTAGIVFSRVDTSEVNGILC